MTKQIIRGQQARKVAGKAAGESRQLKKRKEFVRVHEGEIVRCVCGNEPYRFGFWPCDDFGKVINPINSRSCDHNPPYLCLLCRRMINIRTGAVVGKTTLPDA